MATVSLLNVSVRNNPAPFNTPYEFEITFECLEPLQKDLEWKLTYVGSATSSEHDQELDSLLVGPIPVGVNKFVFEADPPNTSRIPSNEIVGITVILLTCSYDVREFVRVGYYVNNEYLDDSGQAMSEEAVAALCGKIDVSRVQRNIKAEKPRVTRFAIKWDSEESAPPEFPPEQADVDAQEDDETAYGAEEEELEVEVEAEESAAKAQDADMEGVEADVKDDDEESGSGSEDIEAESEDEDEDDLEEEEGEANGEQANHDMDMEDGTVTKEGTNGTNGHRELQHQANVMVH